MATNGILKFQGTNKATFVGGTSNVVIDTVKSSFGIGVDVDGPTSNLHVVGNAYVSTELTVGGTVTAAGFTGPLTGAVTGDGSGLTALNATTIASGTLDAARIPTLNQNTTGSAATLTTPRTIGGVNFDGSAAIVPTTFGAATFSGDVTVDSTTFHVDSTNNRVGIGTTSPGSALEVFSTTGTQMTLRSDSRYSTIFAVDDTGSSFFGNDRGAIRFTTGGDTSGSGASEKMRVLANGNVGIGTTTPDLKLHLYDTTTEPTIAIQHLSANENNSSTNILGNLCLHRSHRSGVGNQVGIRSIRRADTWDDQADMEFYVRNGGNGEQTAMVINSGGDSNSAKVGIGTTSPESLLHVQPTSTNNAFIKAVRHNDLSSTKAIFAVSEYQMTGMSAPGTIIGNHNRDIHIGAVFGAGNVLDGTTGGIRITSTGNVGIGTTSPDYRLHIQNGDASMAQFGPSTSYTTSSLVVGAGTSQVSATVGEICQMITTNGNMHLDAATSRDIYMNFYSGNFIRHHGSGLSSDDRLKTNEELITNATETLLKLSPQKYTKARSLREAETREPFTETGLIAQDIWYDAPELRHIVLLGTDADPVEIKPEAPVEGDIQQDPDYSSWGPHEASVNYDGLIAYLIKSNQELHARIQALENA
jgi:hypothetical protein